MLGENEKMFLPEEVETIIKTFSKPFGLRLNYKSTFPNHRHAIVAHLDLAPVLIINYGFDDGVCPNGKWIIKKVQRNEWIPSLFYTRWTPDDEFHPANDIVDDHMMINSYDWRNMIRQIKGESVISYDSDDDY